MTNSRRKQILLAERGHVCWICDTREWMGQPVPLQMDHIDGNPHNNSRENLRILCGNCHLQTPTYSGKNIGSGNGKRNDHQKEFAEWRKAKRKKPKFSKEDRLARDLRRKYTLRRRYIKDDISFWFDVSLKELHKLTKNGQVCLVISHSFIDDMIRIYSQLNRTS